LKGELHKKCICAAPFSSCSVHCIQIKAICLKASQMIKINCTGRISDLLVSVFQHMEDLSRFHLLRNRLGYDVNGILDEPVLYASDARTAMISSDRHFGPLGHSDTRDSFISSDLLSTRRTCRNGFNLLLSKVSILVFGRRRSCTRHTARCYHTDLGRI
jgi:hypothetical protein